MSDTSEKQTVESIFGPVIYSYTRAQAIEDGVLVDPGPMAKEAGFKIPVALTSAVWGDCVEWPNGDSQQQIPQDEAGRLWDVLMLAFFAIKTGKSLGNQLLFELDRVPRDGHTIAAELVMLKLIIGPGDSGEPVITILQPHES